ncbi:phosphodiester glycosidase family protein [Chlorogloeopsis sp. ULAP01]|uniref:phosphodiester glycosidase family protein n=1 Tax=Chlorogloeopsis sp. ULAP01 TaxID=3056483 RepID=UPI0025AA3D92|nr:phosphodiester glycosidase family protein [Chlorogloeopsis sp. ULAP01]MDM9379861.1 phosphodiester glycosidase family protein [Chlorogloeopsis sp. ULAP01]
MKKIYLLGGKLITSMMLLLAWNSSQQFGLRSEVVPIQNSSQLKNIRYEQRILPQSIVHILLIPPNSKYLIVPALSTKLIHLEEFTTQYKALAILNGGFFDPVNQKTTSTVVLQKQLVANPRNNERLINNPNLKPYLDKIFNRTEFRRYQCGQNIRYDIVLRSEKSLPGCQLIDALGAGPQLLPQLTLEPEGFVDPINKRDAIGSNQPNARTAVGIKSDRTIILVMVAQKSDSPTNSGMSLPAVANLMKSLGAEKAMNLDGGSSSSLYYQGKFFYGKVDRQGNPIKRPVKSVLLVQEIVKASK